MPWNDGLQPGTPAHTLASTDSATIRAVAGPGSGKSFAIKRRIARLLESGINPNQILAITFTRTAAQDLKREILSLGLIGAEQVHARTLHSHALKILMEVEVLQRTGRIPRMIIDHEIKPALRDINNERFGNVRNKKHLLDSYLASWAKLQSDVPGFIQNEIQRDFEDALIEWLKLHEGILVGEVIPVSIKYLRNNPASPEIGKYRSILVDEYQDLNKSEQEFIRLIKGQADIVIVGDDDQSIYSFKFAHPEGIREIEPLYGRFENVTFNECRRCPQQVTRMASRLIANNPGRTLGQLVPSVQNQQGIVQIIQWTTYDEEIDGIARLITEELNRQQISAGDILVLAPRRRIGYLLRDQLLRGNVAVRSYFRESAIDNDAVQQAYSILNIIANPGDVISLRFLLGFGSSTSRSNQYKRLRDLAAQNELSLVDTLHRLSTGILREPGLSHILTQYGHILETIRLFRAEVIENPINAFSNVFIRTADDQIDFFEIDQLFRKAVDEKGVEALQANPDSFEEWFKDVFNRLSEDVALPEIPDDINHVRIMSLHSSKGLSAKFVVLCSMIDFLMPFVPRGLGDEDRDRCIEEQRRLFYVAITRCKASNDFPGRLVISSFLSIFGLDAVRMGIPTSPDRQLNVSSTPFIDEFGNTGPIPVNGNTLFDRVNS